MACGQPNASNVPRRNANAPFRYLRNLSAAIMNELLQQHAQSWQYVTITRNENGYRIAKEHIIIGLLREAMSIGQDRFSYQGQAMLYEIFFEIEELRMESANMDAYDMGYMG